MKCVKTVYLLNKSIKANFVRHNEQKVTGSILRDGTLNLLKGGGGWTTETRVRITDGVQGPSRVLNGIIDYSITSVAMFCNDLVETSTLVLAQWEPGFLLVCKFMQTVAS